VDVAAQFKEPDAVRMLAKAGANDDGVNYDALQKAVGLLGLVVLACFSRVYVRVCAWFCVCLGCLRMLAKTGASDDGVNYDALQKTGSKH
jgi:hypothetical protein